MDYTFVTGIDPGLKQSALVTLRFRNSGSPAIDVVEAEVYDSVDLLNITADATKPTGRHPHIVFIEGYRTRGGYSTNTRMEKAVSDIHFRISGSFVIDNWGADSVITPEIMKLMRLWSWSQKSNHQDLRAAARIALFGMAKSDELNVILYNSIRKAYNLTQPPPAA